MPVSAQGSEERLRSFVVPLASVMPNDDGAELKQVVGTAFLIKDGSGLAMTARHVARALELGYAAGIFAQDDQTWIGLPVTAIQEHPIEDAALIRFPAGDWQSPYVPTNEALFASTEYMLWGYPDDVHHDRMSEGGISPDLVYSQGYVRRRISYELPAVPGRSFLELSEPAGSCCSGAPVCVRGKPWEVVGIYVGERRNEAGTLGVGYAVRMEALAEEWPDLF